MPLPCAVHQGKIALAHQSGVLALDFQFFPNVRRIGVQGDALLGSIRQRVG